MTKAINILFEELEPEVKKFIESTWELQSLSIGGIVSFESNIRNGIKFFTQSMYSHTNFFQKEIGYTLGSEDLKGVVCFDYNKLPYLDNFYYVVKNINFDYLSFIYDFDYAQKVFEKIGKAKEGDSSILNNFINYCVYRNSTEKTPKFEQILNIGDISFDINYINEVSKQINIFMEIKKNLKYGIVAEKPEYFDTYYTYLKEFILLGILKTCIKYYGTRYDLEGTLSVGIAPWNSIIKSNNEFFCSEFVIEALLYAGVYPFDLDSKFPESVSPGDIMDMSIIFGGYDKADNSIITELYEVSNSEGLKLIDNRYYTIIKEYILKIENQKLFFQRQKLLVRTFSSALKVFIFSSNNPIKNNATTVAKGKYSMITIFIAFIAGILSIVSIIPINIKTSLLESNVSSNNSRGVMNELIDGISSIGIFSLKVILFVVLSILIIYYVIPGIIALSNRLKKKY